MAQRVKKSVAPVLDYEGKFLNKDDMIDREKARLKGLVNEVAPERLPLADTVIASIAFQRVHLQELESILTIKGFTEEYQNGANQCGIKQSSESQAYTALANTHLKYQKHLVEILLGPGSSKKEQDPLMAFINS